MPKGVVSRICTSIAADTLEDMGQKAELALYFKTDLLEFRIDRLMSRVTTSDIIAKLSKYAKRAVVTVRTNREGGNFAGGEIERLGIITSLAEMNPAYLDIELSTATANEKWLKALPKKVERIISWHDLAGTPELGPMRETVKQELAHGSIAKVVTTATSVEDNLKTLKLCGETPGRVVSFCMGQLGTPSRLMSMEMQAPIAYAALPNDPVAPGQVSVQTMLEFRGLVSRE
jgi:3-dehydroquinate dehydratase type I